MREPSHHFGVFFLKTVLVFLFSFLSMVTKYRARLRYVNTPRGNTEYRNVEITELRGILCTYIYE